MSDLTIAVLIVLGLMLAYRLGYHHGVAMCVRQMKPLVGQLKELREAVRRR